MLCKAVGGGLCGGRLEVVEVTVLLLIVGEALTHVVEHVLGKVLCCLVGEVCAEPACVEAGFVHTDQTDGREVVLEGAEVTLGVGVQTLFQEELVLINIQEREENQELQMQMQNM